MSIPWVSDDEIEQQALELLRRYGLDGAAPVDVEALELHMGLTITPIHELRSGRIETDGCLGGTREIFVDRWVFDHNLNRYRFTLAHEIAHIVLHGDWLRSIQLGSVDRWVVVLGELGDRDQRRLEIQANKFAASLLMPAGLVSSRLEDRVGDYSDQAEEALRAGVPLQAVVDEVVGQLATKLSEEFEVSDEAMGYRLNNLGLDSRVADSVRALQG